MINSLPALSGGVGFRVHYIFTMATFKVTVMHKGASSTKELIEAINAPEAKRFAEARFPSCKIGAANRVN